MTKTIWDDLAIEIDESTPELKEVVDRFVECYPGSKVMTTEVLFNPDTMTPYRVILLDGQPVKGLSIKPEQIQDTIALTGDESKVRGDIAAAVREALFIEAHERMYIRACL